MIKYSIFAVLLIATLTVQSAENVEIKEKKSSYNKTSKSEFFKTKKEGWYWFEEKSEEKEKEKNIPVPPSPEPIKKESTKESNLPINNGPVHVVINAEWLRVNLPKLRESAINKPTDDNLSAYYYAQRMTVDMASRFANRTEEFFANESELDENNRRPTAGYVLGEHKRTATTEKRKLLTKIFKDVGLWVFVKSDCSFCKKQIPVLDELKRVYGVDILYISLDGQEIPGHKDDNYVYDVSGAARQRLGFEVELTPTIILLKNDGSDAVLLNAGLVDLGTIENKTLLIAKNSGWVNDSEFMQSQQVRDITVLTDNEVLDIEVSGLTEEEKTKNLILKIKSRLKNQPRSAGSKVKGLDK